MQLSKEESRRRWNELRGRMNAWDPLGLIDAGAPPDEYECVVGPLMRMLESAEDSDVMAQYLNSEFRDHFELPVAMTDIINFVEQTRLWYRQQWSRE